MRRHISQREAHRLRRQLDAYQRLEAARQNAWGRDYPGGVHIARADIDVDVVALVRLARKLGHAVVVVSGDAADSVNLYAVPVAVEHLSGARRSV